MLFSRLCLQPKICFHKDYPLKQPRGVIWCCKDDAFRENITLLDGVRVLPACSCVCSLEQPRGQMLLLRQCFQPTICFHKDYHLEPPRGLYVVLNTMHSGKDHVTRWRTCFTCMFMYILPWNNLEGLNVVVKTIFSIRSVSIMIAPLEQPRQFPRTGIQ